MTQSKSVIVIGAGGTFGSSTCLELARRGYKVTGLDKHAYPSLISAGNDLNKIVRTEYADPLYAHLASEAIEVWKSDNVFNSHFHQTGWLVCTSDKRSLTAQNLIYKPYEVLKQTDLKDKIKLIDFNILRCYFALPLEPTLTMSQSPKNIVEASTIHLNESASVPLQWTIVSPPLTTKIPAPHVAIQKPTSPTHTDITTNDKATITPKVSFGNNSCFKGEVMIVQGQVRCT
ncbi:hypothetical protein E3Q23_04416 [Wallemia mellicola]|uniref:FAD dependent oxidoreductase domain-containing protein n=1 Tax=Wallemia mellicola TaxID=1708541 RepID=A0A4T0LG13_9BASI|nr:hypothetical protein E3Q23_04416 [Wallemia mellicola]TIC61105.1 hypothetical protein E3Q01_04430 [Wallemia mellicola]